MGFPHHTHTGKLCLFVVVGAVVCEGGGACRRVIIRPKFSCLIIGHLIVTSSHWRHYSVIPHAAAASARRLQHCHRHATHTDVLLANDRVVVAGFCCRCEVTDGQNPLHQFPRIASPQQVCKTFGWTSQLCCVCCVASLPNSITTSWQLPRVRRSYGETCVMDFGHYRWTQLRYIEPGYYT